MDQTEVARYRALLRDQSQAKRGRLRPLGRWLGVDRVRAEEPRASALAEELPEALVAPLEIAPSFPPRRPLAPLEPVPSPTLVAQPARTRDRLKRAPVTPSEPAPTPDVEISAPPDLPQDVVALAEVASVSRTDPPIERDAADAFVEPPPLGILDLLSPAMIAEYDLERVTPAPAARAFGRREGDPTPEPAPAVDPVVAELSAIALVEPAHEPLEPVLAHCEPVPEPAIDADFGPPVDAAVATEPRADLVEADERAVALAPASEPDDAEPVMLTEAAIEPAPHAQDDGVVVAIASRPARAPLVRRLEPERSPAAVMRNLQTILEAEQSIVDLWRSLGRAAA